MEAETDQSNAISTFTNALRDRGKAVDESDDDTVSEEFPGEKQHSPA